MTSSAPTRERVLQQTGATKTIYVGSMYEKATTNGVSEHRYFVFTPMGRIAVRTETGGTVATRYLHGDMLGSISAVTDEFGKVVQRFAYDPWGRRTAQVGGATCNRGFTDHEHLDELGLVHMNARIYDPVIARFLSADPMVDGVDDAQGYNRYSYVKNNPLRMIDPSGNEGELPEFNATIGHMDLTFGTFSSGSYSGQWGDSTLGGGPAFFGGWQSNYSGLAPFGSSLLNGNSLSEAFKTGVVGPLGITAWDFQSFAPNSTLAPATAVNPGGVWVPSGVDDLLHGQVLAPGASVAVPGGYVTATTKPGRTGVALNGVDMVAYGVNFDVTYTHGTSTVFNWSQQVTVDTLPHPTGTTPHVDQLPRASYGVYYANPSPGNPYEVSTSTINANGVVTFHDNPMDVGPGAFRATVQPVDVTSGTPPSLQRSNPFSNPPFVLNWGGNVVPSNGGYRAQPAPITIIIPPHG